MLTVEEAAEEAYREACDKTFNEVYPDAYREALDTE
jgi:hypothetical protein